MQYVRVICRNPFQVTFFKAREGEGEADLLAHRLRQVLMSAEGNYEYETDTITQEEIDKMITSRIDPRVVPGYVPPSDEPPPLVA
jgi:hypothetical protein